MMQVNDVSNDNLDVLKEEDDWEILDDEEKREEPNEPKEEQQESKEQKVQEQEQEPLQDALDAMEPLEPFDASFINSDTWQLLIKSYPNNYVQHYAAWKQSFHNRIPTDIDVGVFRWKILHKYLPNKNV
jgi:FtsZ-interacting cell division protein YlmF